MKTHYFDLKLIIFVFLLSVSQLGFSNPTNQTPPTQNEPVDGDFYENVTPEVADSILSLPEYVRIKNVFVSGGSFINSVANLQGVYFSDDGRLMHSYHKVDMLHLDDTIGWCKFEFEEEASLDYLVFLNFVWNASWTDHFLTKGIDEFDIYYAKTEEDLSGVDFSDNRWQKVGTFNANIGTVDCIPDIFELDGINAKWIAFDIKSNFGGPWAGISEVLFFKKILVEDIEITAPTTIVLSGAVLPISANISPINVLDPSVTWSVENATPGTSIDHNGILHAGEPGEVTVVVTANDGSGVSAQIQVHIIQLVEEIILSADSEVEMGSTIQVNAIVNPDDATDTTLTWSVLNATSGTSINQSGLLTAGDPGIVTVIATANDTSGIADSIEIEIIEPIILVSQINLSAEANQIYEGDYLQILAEVLPESATNSTVSWSTLGTTPGTTIDANGLLLAGEAGIITVVATANDGSGVTGLLEIEIIPQEILVSEIILSADSTTIYEDTDLQISALVLPANATNKDVVWSLETTTPGSSIDGNGLLQAGAPGNIIVMAKAVDASSTFGILEIEIIPEIIPVTDILLSAESSVISQGSSLQIEATVLPENATDPSITWSVQNATSGTSVDQSGVLTAGETGTVIVVATANDGSGISGTIEITIEELVIPVTDITLSASTSSIIEGETLQIDATVTPANATNPSVTWSVQDATSGTSVDQSGILTAGEAGTVTVVATANDGSGISGTIEITIEELVIPVTDITLSASTSSIIEGETLQINATVTPANATDPSVTWSVQDATAGTSVDQSGILTAGEAGTVTVVATANDGSGISGTIEITIEELVIPVTDITLSASTSSIIEGETLQINATVTPANATDPSVTWSVQDATAGTSVDQSGILTAGEAGTVTVVATANDGSGISGTIEITIEELVILVTDITLSASASSIIEGETLQVDATVSPANATDPSVTWSVQDATAGTSVDQSGMLTAGVAGTVTVVATANDGSGVSGELEITINEVVEEHYYFSITNAFATTAHTNPLNCINRTGLTLSDDNLNDPANATHGNAYGSMFLTTERHPEFRFSWPDAKVITQMALFNYNHYFGGGDRHYTDRGIQEFMLYSSNSGDDLSEVPFDDARWTLVGTYTADRAAEGNTSGTLFDIETELANWIGIDVASNYGNNRTGLSELMLYTDAPSDLLSLIVDVTADNDSVEIGQTMQITANVTPDDVTDKSVTWSLQNATSGTTIDQTGLLTAGDPGVVTVVATSNDAAQKVGTFDITIWDPAVIVLVESINLSTESPGNSVALEGTIQINAEVLPAHATDLSLTWSIISGPAGTTVDASGLVTAGAVAGTATVQAAANDASGITQTIEILVEEAAVLYHVPIAAAFSNPGGNWNGTRIDGMYNFDGLSSDDVSYANLGNITHNGARNDNFIAANTTPNIIIQLSSPVEIDVMAYFAVTANLGRAAQDYNLYYANTSDDLSGVFDFTDASWTAEGSYTAQRYASSDNPFTAFEQALDLPTANWIGIDVLNSHGAGQAGFGEILLYTPDVIAPAIRQQEDSQIEENPLSSVELMPVPAKDWLYIEGINNVSEITFSIFSIAGKTVLEDALTNGNAIDISMLQSGMYLLKISSNGYTSLNKFIID